MLSRAQEAGAVVVAAASYLSMACTGSGLDCCCCILLPLLPFDAATDVGYDVASKMAADARTLDGKEDGGFLLNDCLAADAC